MNINSNFIYSIQQQIYIERKKLEKKFAEK